MHRRSTVEEHGSELHALASSCGAVLSVSRSPNPRERVELVNHHFEDRYRGQFRSGFPFNHLPKLRHSTQLVAGPELEAHEPYSPGNTAQGAPLATGRDGGPRAAGKGRQTPPY